MKLTSEGFVDGRAMPTRYAFGRYRFHPKDLKEDERFELSDNLSPHLAWSDVPEGTRSFALKCHDPDAPSVGTDVNKAGRRVPIELPRADFVHWLLVDLGAQTRSLAEGAFCKGVQAGGKEGPSGPDGTRQGLNNYTQWFADDEAMRGDYFGYDGPCPPWNDERIHWYVFTLYALDVDTLAIDGTDDQGAFDAAAFDAAIEGHVLGQAELRGFYNIFPDARFG